MGRRRSRIREGTPGASGAGGRGGFYSGEAERKQTGLPMSPRGSANPAGELKALEASLRAISQNTLMPPAERQRRERLISEKIMRAQAEIRSQPTATRAVPKSWGREHPGAGKPPRNELRDEIVEKRQTLRATYMRGGMNPANYAEQDAALRRRLDELDRAEPSKREKQPERKARLTSTEERGRMSARRDEIRTEIKSLDRETFFNRISEAEFNRRRKPLLKELEELEQVLFR